MRLHKQKVPGHTYVVVQGHQIIYPLGAMMKVKLIFMLPEEHDEHLAAVHAQTMAAAMRAMDERLRRFDKDGEPTPERVEALIRDLRETISDVMLRVEP